MEKVIDAEVLVSISAFPGDCVFLEIRRRNGREVMRQFCLDEYRIPLDDADVALMVTTVSDFLEREIVRCCGVQTTML